jgi:hypothetical protein
MPIQVQPTPNPNARKFVLPEMRFAGSRNFTLDDLTANRVDDPLARQLLALEGVYNVLLARDFVTVNKVPQTDWPPLINAVTAILDQYLAQPG